MEETTTKQLFTALISDIKSYSGNDPLLPWLRGIKKLRDSLPRHLLKDKLPRFLQKCAQSFESDRRYRNDLRYLRIWLHLMDYVDDPKALLKTMEKKKIGLKRSLFYQAYALYYEKLHKFDQADRMYRLGVQNLAEPLDDLQKSYGQFVQRMERHKNKRVQRQETKSISRSMTNISCSSKENEYLCKVKGDSEGSFLTSLKKESKNCKNILTEGSRNLQPLNGAKSADQNNLYRDDSVLVKFVDSAIVGRSEAEDACHHGLVEPTVNMKEAMNAINSMFREPMEPEKVRRSSKSQPKSDQSNNNSFAVYVDEKSDDAGRLPCQGKLAAPEQKTLQPLQEPLKIFVDDEMSNNSELSASEPSTEGSQSSSSGGDAFVFLRPDDHESESSNDKNVEKSSRKTRTKYGEDTVVRRFVGSAILDEPEVESICHHGLVDPTINLKEAMEDINGMFGKPIEFVRTTRRKRQEKAAASEKNDNGGFLILADDEFNSQEVQNPQSTSSKDKHDLHEPTVFTKEAMDDINDLFKMPLDF